MKRSVPPRVEELEDRMVPALVPGALLPTDPSPSAVVAADFNNDGKRDIVAASQSGDTVNVFLSNGNGTFGVPDAFDANNSPVALAVGDFDDDNNRDLAVANSQDGVSVLFGNGNGTFDAPILFSTGINVSGIVAADFNGDGNSDLAATVTGSHSVKVMLYVGGMNIFSITSYDVTNVPSAVAAADFNNDSKPDLAVTRFSQDDVVVLLNNGAGGFPTKNFFDVGDGPGSVASGDFNDDDKRDLAVTNFNGGTVSVLLGSGTGSFAAANHFAAGVKPDSVVVGNFTSPNFLISGIPDLIVVNRDSDVIHLLVGDGAGNFGAPLAIGVGDQPVAAASANFNSDFLLDLVVANRMDNTLTVLFGAPDPPPLPPPSPPPLPPAVLDVTGLLALRGRWSRSGSRWRCRLTLQNLSGGPLFNLKLVLRSLVRRARLLNASGISQIAAPGLPYLNVPAAVLNSGESATLFLLFKAKRKVPLNLLVVQALSSP